MGLGPKGQPQLDVPKHLFVVGEHPQRLLARIHALKMFLSGSVIRQRQRKLSGSGLCAGDVSAPQVFVPSEQIFLERNFFSRGQGDVFEQLGLQVFDGVGERIGQLRLRQRRVD